MERKKLSFKGWVVWLSMAIISTVVVMALLYDGALLIVPIVVHAALQLHFTVVEGVIIALLSAVCLFMAVWRLADFMHEQLSRWFHCMAEKGGFYASI